MRKGNMLLAAAALLFAACGTTETSGGTKWRVWDKTRSAPVTDWLTDKSEAEQKRKEYEKRFPHNITVIFTQ